MTKFKVNQRPNIILLLGNGHHYAALGAAGNPAAKTPNLDALAAAGMRFTRCAVTNPAVRPNLASLWSGQYGFLNGVSTERDALRPEAPRLAELLSSRGYVTAFAGAWHQDQRPTQFGFDYMSHVYLGGPADRRGLVLAHGERDNGAHVEGHPTHLFTEAALSLLESKLAQPFFVTVSYLAPGRPIGLPEAGPRPVEPDDVELPPNFAAEPPYDPGTLGMQEERRLKRPLQAAEARQAWAGYYGRLAYLDQQIGRLLGLLESREDLNDTLVVYAGHSGISLGAHGLLGNMTLYDEGVLAPLIIRGGGAPAGLTSGSLVHLMDLMPTLSNYGSVPAGANLHARSLTPVLSGRRETHRQSLMAYYPNGFRMIRTDRHKLVQNVYAKREELFDLAADPYETADRSTDPAYANALRDLRSELESWWKSMKAPAARA